MYCLLVLFVIVPALKYLKYIRIEPCFKPILISVRLTAPVTKSQQTYLLYRRYNMDIYFFSFGLDPPILATGQKKIWGWPTEWCPLELVTSWESGAPLSSEAILRIMRLNDHGTILGSFQMAAGIHQHNQHSPCLPWLL